jgi:hypothetical protein
MLLVPIDPLQASQIGLRLLMVMSPPLLSAMTCPQWKLRLEIFMLRQLTQSADAMSAPMYLFQTDMDKIITLEETGIYASLHPSYARCYTGKRCYVKTPDQRVFKKYSLLVAITSKGVIGWELYEKGAVNGERLTAFIKNKIAVADFICRYNNLHTKRPNKNKGETLT